MNRFDVIWSDEASDVLIAAWLHAANRPAINTAEREIARLLRRDPVGAGKLLSEGLYQIRQPPLVAFYTIDLQKAFECLDRMVTWGSEAMPSHPIPITGVHFGIGQDDVFYRDGVATDVRSANAIWIAVDSVRLE